MEAEEKLLKREAEGKCQNRETQLQSKKLGAQLELELEKKRG